MGGMMHGMKPMMGEKTRRAVAGNHARYERNDGENVENDGHAQPNDGFAH